MSTEATVSPLSRTRHWLVVSALAAGGLFALGACSDDDGDGAVTDEEVDQVDEGAEDLEEEVDEGADEVEEEIEEGEEEVED